MLHPDYQYTPRLIAAMASMIASGEYDVVLARASSAGRARRAACRVYKYFSNRLLTAVENLMLGVKLSEYHTGYRAFSREVLETLPLEENSDDFVFDNQMLAQARLLRLPHRRDLVSRRAYFAEASSINFRRSVVYGLGVLATAARFRLHQWGVWRSPLFDRGGRRLAFVPDAATA